MEPRPPTHLLAFQVKKSPVVVTIFRRDEVGHTYAKHGVRVQYAVVYIAVYGRLQHLTKTWSYDTIEEFNVDSKAECSA